MADYALSKPKFGVRQLHEIMATELKANDFVLIQGAQMEYLLSIAGVNHFSTRDADNARLVAGHDGFGVGTLAYLSLIREVELTPKPGLVDCRNSGSHQDMDLHTFYRSAKAIAKWFPEFFNDGYLNCHLPVEDFIPHLRASGIKCENDMFAATLGINTHKGGIFSLGFLCAAAGRLYGNMKDITISSLCNEVAAMSADMVQNELHNCTPQTSGEILFHKYGLTGARREMSSGFATARKHSLPVFKKILCRTGSEEKALHAALLTLLASNQDTNLVSRGGIDGLNFVQEQAMDLIEKGGVENAHFFELMNSLNDALVERNLSPGGSADLLAVTWFLSNFPE